MRCVNKKGQLNLSFGWLFAIIVGAVILFLAIFGVGKIIKTSPQETQAVGAKQFGVLLNNLETSFQSAQKQSINIGAETRVYNNPVLGGSFGEQRISLSEYRMDEWQPAGVESAFENRYIFSKEYVEGREYYLFVKPFSFPYKVADVIYLISKEDKYCFEDAPREIEEELENLNLGNVALNCSIPGEYTEVCFEGKCDIYVDYDRGYIEKEDESFYFEGDALMYAAIFSDKEIYDKQIKRLMMRASELASLYIQKAQMMASRNCEPRYVGDLKILKERFDEIEDSSELLAIGEMVEEINTDNKYSNCALW